MINKGVATGRQVQEIFEHAKKQLCITSSKRSKYKYC